MRLTPLHDSSAPAFAALLHLYRQSFPPEEQKSPAALAAMLHNPIYTVLLAHTPTTPAPIALAIVASPHTAPISLLEYLATAPVSRGQGIGRALFQQIAAQAGQQNRPLLIEVEADPNPADTASPEARRRRFYRSLGALELSGLHYRMPTVAAAPPPPMHLFLHHPAPPAAIPRSTLRSWLTALYTEIYAQPAHDPRIDAMLDPLPALVPLS